MNLDQAKALLSDKGINFHTEEYLCEADFLKHICLFPYIKNAADYMIISVVIESNNGYKDLELQFVKTEKDYIFKELWFGEYSFEAFAYESDILADEVLADIERIMTNSFTAFVINDLKREHWVANGLIPRGEEYEKRLKRDALKLRSWIQRIRKVKVQYEFYDWNNYEKIIK